MQVAASPGLPSQAAAVVMGGGVLAGVGPAHHSGRAESAGITCGCCNCSLHGCMVLFFVMGLYSLNTCVIPPPGGRAWVGIGEVAGWVWVRKKVSLQGH